MAREFGTTGDEPHKKNRRQIPEGTFLRHHEEGNGGTRIPNELAEKNVGESAPLRSPRETADRCMETISTLLTTVRTKGRAHILDDLSKVYAQRGEQEPIRKLGESIEKDEDKDAFSEMQYRSKLGSIYWRAAQLGDETAAQQLHDLLQTEKDQTRAEGGKRKSRSKIDSVVAACAEDNVPATVWIDNYALNPEDKMRLKTQYWQKATEKGHDTPAQGYRDELTDEFFNSRELSTLFSWEQATKLYAMHDEPEMKQEIFEEFRQLYHDLLRDEHPFRWKDLSTFCNFAVTYLEDKSIAQREDVEWIENRIKGLSTAFTEGGEDRAEISRYTKGAKLSLIRYHGGEPGTIIEKIDALTAKNFTELMKLETTNVTTGENSVVYVDKSDMDMNLRDIALYVFATEAVESEDLDSAKEFISNSAGGIAGGAKSFFDSIETLDTLNAVKPDEMTLTLNEGLATHFKIKETFLGNDADEIEDLIRSLPSSEEDWAIHIDREKTVQEQFRARLLSEGLGKLYELDKGRAHALSSELIDEALGYVPVREVAKLQIDHGDTSGWEAWYKAIHPKDIQAYTELALYATQTMQAE